MGNPKEFNYDAAAARAIFMDSLRQVGEEKAHEMYARDPLLFAFAQERSAFWAAQICEEFEVDRDIDPAALTLTSAFTKIAFTFTNPRNHAESLSDEVMGGAVGASWRALAAVHGADTTLQGLAYRLDLLAAFAFADKLRIEKAGMPQATSLDEQFKEAYIRFEAANWG
jgi:hypothetical protein